MNATVAQVIDDEVNLKIINMNELNAYSYTKMMENLDENEFSESVDMYLREMVSNQQEEYVKSVVGRLSNLEGFALSMNIFGSIQLDPLAQLFDPVFIERANYDIIPLVHSFTHNLMKYITVGDINVKIPAREVISAASIHRMQVIQKGRNVSPKLTINKIIHSLARDYSSTKIFHRFIWGMVHELVGFEISNELAEMIAYLHSERSGQGFFASIGIWFANRYQRIRHQELRDQLNEMSVQISSVNSWHVMYYPSDPSTEINNCDEEFRQLLSFSFS